MTDRSPNQQAEPIRLRRAESFLGVHFDFHAKPNDRMIGSHTTRRMIREIIRLVKPDYIQCDCKGHPGLSSYPTRTGNPAPSIIGDPLRTWRKETARHGVALFTHYSGVWDYAAVARHPSWARLNADRKRDPRAVSVFGPYLEKLLIPQMRELRDVYGVDGIWVDGDCWATGPDYGNAAVAAFQTETGHQEVPQCIEDIGYFEHTEICRAAFRRYLSKYVNALHEGNPQFQIASNWAFSSLMPEPVSAAVDFLSGDYTFADSVNSARFEGRYLEGAGMPWDLMAWSFTGRFEDACWTTKTAIQLQREAAVVIALGGGFQAYFQQSRNGSVPLRQMQLMAEVAAFCRERQRFCHRSKPVPQIAMLFSKTALYRSSDRLFGPWGKLQEPFCGILQCLLESQNSVEILSEDRLLRNANDYPVIVIPEWHVLPPSLVRTLHHYVRQGGSLIVIGSGPVRFFEKALRVKRIGTPKKEAQWLECGGNLAGMLCTRQHVRLLPGARQCGTIYSTNDLTGSREIAASVARYGKGRILGIYADIGDCYRNSAHSVIRNFLKKMVSSLFRKPIVEVIGSSLIDVSVRTINGHLAINLVNTAGPHSDKSVFVFDEIPPVGPVRLKIRSKKKTARVTLQPKGTTLRHTYSQGVISLTTPPIAIHEVIMVE